MDIYSYQSFDEPRTANRHKTPIKSIQGWKNHSPKQNSVQSNIISSLHDTAEGRNEEFNQSLAKTLSYAPQKLQSHAPIQKQEFQFHDVIDVINPLQHIPLVSTAYRNLTGDELHPLSNIIGGALYGGPVGAVTGTMNAVSKIQTGKDIGEHALGFMKPNKSAETVKQATDIFQNSAYQDDVTVLTLAAMPPRQLQ